MGRFPHVGALLQYLHRCAQTVRARYFRESRKRNEVSLSSDELEAYPSEDTCLEILDNLEKQAQLHWLQKWSATHLRDEQEQLIYQLSFQLGLAPQQIVAMYPEHFPSKKEVYRIKERILKRLKACLRAQRKNK